MLRTGPMKAIAVVSLGPVLFLACDLAIEHVEVPATACPGEDIGPDTVLDVINQGTDDVDDLFHIGWYLSSDALWDPTDVLLVGGRDQVDGLAADAVVSVDVAVNRIPDAATPGPQYILTVVDEFDDVSESDEDNNVEASPITIGACGGACDGANVALIEASFSVCPATSQVGQSAAAGGVTCEQVCCVLGFSGCAFRGAQADYNACTPTPTVATGTCSDAFGPTWSSQCVCEP